jgi:type II secretory pathway component PulC
MKINKQIMACAVWTFFLGGASLGVAAGDPSSGMIMEKKEIERLMADKDEKPVFIEWGKRNPFDTSALTLSVLKPESKPKKIKPHFVLQGIFLGSSKPSVIINGKVVGIGNNINGATVKEIKDSSVVLIDTEGQKQVLSLEKGL